MIAAAYANDLAFQDDQHTKSWSFLDNLWWDGDRIVVPDSNAVKLQVLHDCHDAALAGHPGVRKTVQHIQRHFTWDNKFMGRRVTQAYD